MSYKVRKLSSESAVLFPMQSSNRNGMWVKDGDVMVLNDKGKTISILEQPAESGMIKLYVRIDYHEKETSLLFTTYIPKNGRKKSIGTMTDLADVFMLDKEQQRIYIMSILQSMPDLTHSESLKLSSVLFPIWGCGMLSDNPPFKGGVECQIMAVHNEAQEVLRDGFFEALGYKVSDGKYIATERASVFVTALFSRVFIHVASMDESTINDTMSAKEVVESVKSVIDGIKKYNSWVEYALGDKEEE